MKANVVRLQANQQQEKLLRTLGDRASALWNVANFEYRQAFIKKQKTPTYTDQCAALKEHPVFRSLPSDIAQEVLKKLGEAWKSFKALRLKHQVGTLKNKPGLVDYRKNKDGSRPTDWIPVKDPRSYKVSQTEVTLPLPCDLRKQVGRFSLSYCGTVRFLGDAGRAEVQWDSGRGRWYFSFSVEESCKPKKRDFARSAAIDLGVRILASLSIEARDDSLHFLGRHLLKDWDYFGRQIAQHQQELSHRSKEQRSSKKLRRLFFKRKARLVAAWEALAVRVVSLLRVEKVGMVCLGWPKEILREASYSAKWNGRIHSFWSFDQVLKILEKHLAKAGIESKRVGERGTSSHCPWCESGEVVRTPRHVLSCRSCKRKIHSDQAGSRNILKKENPGISWDALEARARPDTRRWNKHRWVDASNRAQLRSPSAAEAFGILAF